MFFWCLQFPQKTNENNSTWGTIVVKLNFFVRWFLGELKIPKRHFEINWLLCIYSASTLNNGSLSTKIISHAELWWQKQTDFFFYVCWHFFSAFQSQMWCGEDIMHACSIKWCACIHKVHNELKYDMNSHLDF